MWHDSFICDNPTTSATPHMPNFHVWHDTFAYVTWLIHVCDMTFLWVTTLPVLEYMQHGLSARLQYTDMLQQYTNVLQQQLKRSCNIRTTLLKLRNALQQQLILSCDTCAAHTQHVHHTRATRTQHKRNTGATHATEPTRQQPSYLPCLCLSLALSLPRSRSLTLSPSIN